MFTGLVQTPIHVHEPHFTAQYHTTLKCTVKEITDTRQMKYSHPQEHQDGLPTTRRNTVVVTLTAKIQHMLSRQRKLEPLNSVGFPPVHSMRPMRAHPTLSQRTPLLAQAVPLYTL
jgi:hypothetical protein